MKLKILICPKCSSQHKERDNFCIECGKNLKVKTQENKKLKYKYK